MRGLSMIADLKQVTHIIPTGTSKDRILQGLKQHLVHKAVLLVGFDDTLEKNLIVKTARAIDDALRGFAEVEILELETNDVFEIALKLVDMINNERKNNREVMINASCSTSNVGIACYIAALATKATLYTTVSKCGKDKLPKVQLISPFPLKEIPPEQIEILEALLGKGVDSLDELINKMRPHLKKNTTAFNNERARICHHIRALREAGLVETEKVGKNLRVNLNSIGQIYLKGKICSLP